MSVYSDNNSEGDSLPWLWRVCTRLRIQEAYDFCLTVKPTGLSKKEEGGDREMLGVSTTPAFDVEQVLAAVGLPSAPIPARRVPLSGDLFEPKKGEIGTAPMPPAEFSDIIPKVVRRSSKEKNVGPSAPLMKLPYPFTGYGAQAAPKDQVPFPPSPGSRKEKRRSPTTSGSSRQQPTPAQAEDDDDAEEEEDEEEEEEAVGEAETGKEESSDACPRTSGSMSSLGQPIMSRYPFQFRRPHARGGSASHSPPQSDDSPSSNSHSSHTQSTQSTGNRETSSEAQLSPTFSGSVLSSPSSGYMSGSPIPMPPRHPRPGRGRARAGTVPTAFPSSPSPVLFPGRFPSRLRADSQDTENLGSGYESFMLDEPEEEEEEEEEEDAELQMMEQPEPEGPHEAAEGEDSVGLLGVMPRSPRSSNVSSRRRRGSYASRSDSVSTSSRSRAGSAVRSRTQSLIQSLGAASRSSIDLVQSMRSRTKSMVRLEEDPGQGSDSRSHSGSGSEGVPGANENYTFGQPIRVPMGRRTSPTRLRPASSSPSIATTSAFTARADSPEREPQGLGIPIPQGGGESQADISTAAQSFITAPATLAGTSDSSEHPQSWGEHMIDRPRSDFPGAGFVGPH